jgi:glycerate dehydrogenase
MRGVFLDLRTVDRDDLDLTWLRSSVKEWIFHDWTAPEQIIERVRDADIVVSNKARLEEITLRSADRLKLVCIAATGTNNIDLDSCRSLDITVCNVTGYATTSVVEHVYAQILSLTRRLTEYRAASERSMAETDDFCLMDFPIRN